MNDRIDDTPSGENPPFSGQALYPIGYGREAQSELKFRQALKANEREARALAIRYDASRDEALQAKLAKTASLWRMSHQVRTPLHSVPGFAQLLKTSNLDDEQLEAVGNIRGGSPPARADQPGASTPRG